MWIVILFQIMDSRHWILPLVWSLCRLVTDDWALETGVVSLVGGVIVVGVWGVVYVVGDEIGK